MWVSGDNITDDIIMKTYHMFFGKLSQVNKESTVILSSCCHC